MIKTLRKLEGNLNLTKNRYKESITNIILNGEKLEAFPLRSGARQDYPLSALPFRFSAVAIKIQVYIILCRSTN